MNDWFNKFATKTSSITGRSYAFLLSVLLVVVWAILGPPLNYSFNWQLFINTITTVITYLMVFVIQNSQNRSANATHIKLDAILELLGLSDEAIRNLENYDDKRLEQILEEVQRGKKAEVDKAARAILAEEGFKSSGRSTKTGTKRRV